MTNIIVEVRGGVVVAVHSRTDNVDVKVLDWDNVENGYSKKEAEDLEKETKEMVVVW